jgi:hypothetical protein
MPPPPGIAPSCIEAERQDPGRTTALSPGRRRLRLASAASVSLFALGISILGGCDPDSNSHLIAPVGFPMLTGDSIQCPYGSDTDLDGSTPSNSTKTTRG